MTESSAPQTVSYVTTPIYYVNDRPHIGHIYTTTVCDVWARFQRLLGRDTFFLTGTDEHAAKVADAAAERGLTPQQWADQNAESFRTTFQRLGIENDDFIRTTERRHIEKVQTYVKALIDAGDVYLSDYVGWYDANQEEYVPENKARELDFKSPINGRPLVKKTEKNYFFRLSGYREQLLQLLEGGEGADGVSFDVQPEARRNEIVHRIRDAEDVPISRTGASGWGIPMPGDEEHTIYVWIDALFNYLTTVDTDERRHYWQSGPVHVLAKDILWFHAAIWPAVLLALRKCPGYDWVNLPRLVYCHSFWISEGQKMSKSLGNFIDLEKIDRYVEHYSLDALRYFLATQGPLGATDSDFSADNFHDAYSSALANTVGNCASRVTAMISKYFDGRVPEPTDSSSVVADHDWPRLCADAVRKSIAAMDRFDLAGAIEQGMGLIRRVDGFINQTEPFKLAKDESRGDDLSLVLYQCAEVLRIASLLLWPACPTKIEQLWEALRLSINPRQDPLDDLAQWGALQPGSEIERVALFPRVDALESLAAT